MKANESFILKFFDGADKKFIIPVYQRAYNWRKEHCDRLFKDLLAVHREKYESHFFGGIVYVAYETAGTNEYLIIDGQQRLTTVSLLLIAIRNFISDQTEEYPGINLEKITEAYLIDKYAPEEKKLKLKLVRGDSTAYDHLLYGREKIKNSTVTDNYEFFYKSLSKLEHDEVIGLYNAIQKLAIVQISLHPAQGDDPQLIFESLNSTGLDLEESDKIRNFVLMKLEAKAQDVFYENYWSPLENSIAKRDLNSFFKYFLSVKTREFVKEDRLYFVFKAYRNSLTGNIEDIFKDILEYAKIYNDIQAISFTDIRVRHAVKKIKSLELKSVTPILFDIFMSFKKNIIDCDELIDCLHLLECYLIRRLICNGSKGFNKMFIALGAEVERLKNDNGITYFEALKYALINKSKKSRLPSNQEFFENFMTFDFYNGSHAIIKFVFESLENFENKELVAVEEQIEDGSLTIEHIMPQTLSNDWRKDLGDRYETIHSKYLDTIGNLTLTAYNSDYSNLTFIKKRDMQGKGFASSKLRLNSYCKSISQWGEKEITERAALLYQDAEKIWPFPEVNEIVQEGNNGTWIYWDDDFDYTNRTISKIKVLNSEIDTADVTDAYKKICEILYGLDNVMFAQMQYRWFSTDKKSVRNPHELDECAYIETKLDSNTKIAAIKNLAKHFDLDSEDIKFYVDAQFDINDEHTFKLITIGQLAYQLISKLLLDHRIADDEIDAMKTKEYGRKTFAENVYPVLANSRADNKGKSEKYRYYAKPVKVGAKNIYISSEWFDEAYNDLIEWYKKHLPQSQN